MTGIRFLKAAAVCLATLGVAIPQVPALADGARTGSPVKAQKGATLPDIALTAGGTLSGRVVDHTGKVLEGAEVSLLQGKKQLTTAMTNQDGVYSFKNLKGGVYGISSGNTEGVFRVWNERTAPPSAKEHALLVMGENGARGQFGAVDPTLVLLTAGVIAAVVLSALTLSKVNSLAKAETPSSP